MMGAGLSLCVTSMGGIGVFFHRPTDGWSWVSPPRHLHGAGESAMRRSPWMEVGCPHHVTSQGWMALGVPIVSPPWSWGVSHAPFPMDGVGVSLPCHLPWSWVSLMCHLPWMQLGVSPPRHLLRSRVPPCATSHGAGESPMDGEGSPLRYPSRSRVSPPHHSQELGCPPCAVSYGWSWVPPCATSADGLGRPSPATSHRWVWGLISPTEEPGAPMDSGVPPHLVSPPAAWRRRACRSPARPAPGETCGTRRRRRKQNR